jgi:signal peptidase II
VVDFIHFSFWPAFNVADSAITVGVTLLMISFFLAERNLNASDTA